MSFDQFMSSQTPVPCFSWSLQTWWDYCQWISSHQHIGMQIMCFHQFLSSHTLCVHMNIFQIYFLKNTYQFWYSKHIEFASNRRGLSSTCILCLHFQLQCIQVVVQHRSFLLKSHSEMLTSHRVDKYSIYDVQLVRSLVWLSLAGLQEQILLYSQCLLSICSLLSLILLCIFVLHLLYSSSSYRHIWHQLCTCFLVDQLAFRYHFSQWHVFLYPLLLSFFFVIASLKLSGSLSTEKKNKVVSSMS